MKTFIIALLIAFNIEAATFKFKDGTIVQGEIFQRPFSIGNPSPEGLILKVNKKFYMHHYPSKTFSKEVIIDHGNGTYTIKNVTENYPAPAPPEEGPMNPHELPICVPARINFIHFAPETLNNLYKYYSYKTKYHKSISDKYPNSIDHLLAFKENKDIALSIYKAAYSKKYKNNSPSLSAEWRLKVIKEYGKKSPKITWLGN